MNDALKLLLGVALSLLILVSLYAVVRPRSIWYWQVGWYLKEPDKAEPSNYAIASIRARGTLAALVCLVFIILLILDI